MGASGTHTHRRFGLRAAALLAGALVVAGALVAAAVTPAGGERRAEPPMRIEKITVKPKQLGKGFVNRGLPLIVHSDRRGRVKGKVVVNAKGAKRLGLWENPHKMKPRSVAKKKFKVKPGRVRKVRIKPHERYRDEFRDASLKKLRNARFEERAVLRNRRGRKLKRVVRTIAVHTRR